ncbi:BTB/POZ domain containing protein [Nitzschia inconspicua]|uniref:BTB/POZ domain containing protein n=1 Tax=Nitzschia inconspicua TaxID=303405 RepID=A0A9K3KLL3_9STRA|nr:BTB/POZ domain containing protein [Nitzschia inconspicua]
MSSSNIIVDDEGFPEDEGDHSSDYDRDDIEEEEDYSEYDDEEEEEEEEEHEMNGDRSYEQESSDDQPSFEEDGDDYYDNRHHEDFQKDHYHDDDDDDDDNNNNNNNYYDDDGDRPHRNEDDDSYETDTQFDEEEENDDIRSSTTPYSTEEAKKKLASSQPSTEDGMQTPTREEVEQVRMNYNKNFGYPQLEKETQVIPKTSRSSTTSTNSSRRGRSPTPKKKPPPQYYPPQSSRDSDQRDSSQTPLSQKPKLGQKVSEDAIDAIQATVGDASYNFGKNQLEQYQEKPQSSTSLPGPEQPLSKPSFDKAKSSFALNGGYPMTKQNGTTSPSTTAVPASPTASKNEMSPQKSPTASSSHSLKRRSNHRKPTSLVGAPRISWMSDPYESFSDWTVKVLFDDVVDVYHVHRNIMAFGNRKSNFFLKEFRKQQNFEDTDPADVQVSYIKLPASQAKVFPMVLDFIYYTKEATQTLTAERACNVFKLAELLEIPMLQKAIADFYAKNLSLKNLGEFLLAASKSKADRLLVVSKAKIGQMIIEKPELSGLVPPKFMADILLISHRQLEEARAKEPEKYTEALVQSQSRYWSKAAYICAVQNESVLTVKLFDELLSEESLPYIDSAVAPKLLLMDAKFRGQTNGDHGPSSLQRRCIDSLTTDFQQFQRGFATPEACSNVLKALPSEVLAEILMKTMAGGSVSQQ